MAIMKSKGTVLKMTISSVLTAIPGIVSIDKSGEGGESMDVRALDSSAGLPKAATGFVNPPEIGGELLYDAANAVHVAMKSLMRTPANNVITLTYTDAGPVTESWTSVTLGMDESFEGTKPATTKFKFTCTGTAS